MKKEYKKVLRSMHITNAHSFTNEIDWFLKNNPDIKIIETIVHKPYHVTIIYSELIEVKN